MAVGIFLHLMPNDLAFAPAAYWLLIILVIMATIRKLLVFIHMCPTSIQSSALR